MAKKKRKPEVGKTPVVPPFKESKKEPAKESGEEPMTWYQELISRPGVESLITVFLLVMLFRTFEAEGFVIPTGSMAPTLHGRHKDLQCEQCGFQFQVGASNELATIAPEQLPPEMRHANVDISSLNLVTSAICPNCRYYMNIDVAANPYHRSYSGDRIYVDKLAYQRGEPLRWEPIVFKYPGNAKQNYIKRNVGLPNETVRIRHGDIFVRPNGANEFTIARKPADRLLRMLQLVHDSDFVSAEAIKNDWLARWRPGTSDSSSAWKTSEDRKRFSLAHENNDQVAWLRYHHCPPGIDYWKVDRDQPASDVTGDQLISDFYGYNSGVPYRLDSRTDLQALDEIWKDTSGKHWVGDLAIQVSLDVRSDSGQVLLDLVEGGRHYSCTIDVATGQASVQIDGGLGKFNSSGGSDSIDRITAQTNVTGTGEYEIRFANVDDQVVLWIDGEVVQFVSDGENVDGSYTSPANVRPRWTEEDAGDLEPGGSWRKTGQY